MKMKCINQKTWVHHDTHQIEDGPIFGEIVTVVGDVTPYGYDLKEWPCPDDFGWRKDLFVPVVRIDCTKEIAESFKEVLEVPDKEEILEDAFS